MNLENSIEASMNAPANYSEICAVPLKSGNWLIYRGDRATSAILSQGAYAGFSNYLAQSNCRPANPEIQPLLDDLQSLDFFNREQRVSKNRDYKATALTISPTSGCNLACSYCYAEAGREKTPALLDTAKAEKAIDHVIRNCLEVGLRRFKLTLHGGGEPISHFKFCKEIVSYATKACQKVGLSRNVTLGTNGVLSSAQLAWVLENIDSVALSLDGDHQAHDAQRPIKGGGGSLSLVLRSIASFEQNMIPYGVRVTVTLGTVKRLKEIVEFIAKHTNCPNIHMEPVSLVGRAKTLGLHDIDPEIFLENFIEAQKHAKTLGRKLRYSSGDPYSVRDRFCGAAGSNMVITPEGNISSCYEVTRPDDKRAAQFFLGKIDDQAGVQINTEVAKALDKRTVDNLPHCRGCIAKYNCAGDCLTRVDASSDDVFDTSENPRCYINREILIRTLLNAMGVSDEPVAEPLRGEVREMRILKKATTQSVDSQTDIKILDHLTTQEISLSHSECDPFCACECLNDCGCDNDDWDPCPCECLADHVVDIPACPDVLPDLPDFPIRDPGIINPGRD